MRSASLASSHGTFKATVLIETLPAAFEMDEILYEMRDHIVGLNCGRWDYIFSYIKRLGKNPAFLTPDRADMTMGKAFLNAYSLLLIKTCHRRGAFAMGGMAAQIPVKGDDKANEEAFAKVRADKEREAGNGHDGTWVAHPDLVPVAMEVFDRLMPGKNQLEVRRDDVQATQKDLIEVHKGKRTEEGLGVNIRVGVQYIEAWLRGRGAVPIYNLMEDAATAEISRAQIWQWLYQKARLDDGREVTPALFREALKREMERVQERGRGQGLRRGPLQGGDPALLRHVARRHVRGVPDAPGLQADRLKQDFAGGPTDLSGAIWVFLAWARFAAESSRPDYWILLDFLGFSRQNLDFSMGYAEFWGKEFFAGAPVPMTPAGPESEARSRQAEGRGMLMGQSLPRFPIISKKLSPRRSHPAGKWSALDPLACQRISA